MSNKETKAGGREPAAVQAAVEEAVQAAVEVEVQAAVPETVHSLKELVKAHKQQFGCSREMVLAAMLCAKRQEATIREAKKIVADFRKREVK